MRVLIAGCGYVGTALGVELAAGGHEVFGLRRNVEILPPPVRPVAADLADAAALSGLPRGLDAVVYAVSAGARDAVAYRAAYVDGLRNLLDALERAGERPRRVLFTSSTGVYGQRGGEWVDEDAPAEPADFTGALVLEGERVLAASGLPACAVRLGGIYGPGRTALVERVRSGRARLPAGPPRYTNRIHRDDCAGALRHLLERDRVDPIVVGVDCEPAEQGAVLRWLAVRLGVSLAPAEPAPPAGGPAVSAPARAATNKRCSSARLRASGYRFRFPTFREGYGALLGEAGGGRDAQAQGRTS